MIKLLIVLLLQNLFISVFGFSGDATAYADKLSSSSAGKEYNCGFNYINPYAQTNYLAINTAQYNSGRSCGNCVDIQFEGRSLIGYVVDSCGSCAYGDVDLSIPMYLDLIQQPIGRTRVSWNWIDCSSIVNGTITLALQSGSSIWWIGLQVNNAIAETENITINNIQLVPSTYNYWHLPSGTPLTEPITIILTSIDNSIITETINSINSVTGIIDTKQQYTIPSCGTNLA